jgi:HK97 family phage portal protein
MKEKRSLFSIIFGNKTQKVVGTYLQMMSGFNPVYTKTSENVYDNNIVRECINTIATHSAKLLPKHIQRKNGLSNNIKGDINYLLSVQPNPLMTTYDFLYRTVSILYTQNNVFIYVDKDITGMIRGLYPLNFNNCELIEHNNEIYIDFKFINGNSYTIPYSEVIHLRRFYNEHDIYGSSNDVLTPAIETVNTSTDGIRNAIKTSMALKGVLKYSNAMLKEKDIKKNRDQFVEDFINNLGQGSGIAGLDSKADFQAIDLKPLTLDKDQLGFINENVFDYFGINKKIVQSCYTDEEWNAFFESVIEPLAIQMSNAFTVAIFNEKSIRDGHAIVFETNRIKYAKTETKIKLLKETAILGLYTIDEAREILDLPAIGGEEGRKRLQTLNVIDTKIANQYQGGGNSGESNEGN